jgi:hypothetical protein
MRPTVWPREVRQKIVSCLNNSADADVQNWARLVEQNDDSMMFDQFQQRLHQHDKYRNTDFAKTFPELAPYI